jgi:phosphoglycerate kinase
MDKEITALDKGLKAHDHPTVFILGGTKVDDSIKVIQNVLNRGGADRVLTSGVVAIVFMMASGLDVGEANRKFIKDQKYLDQISIAAELLKAYPDKIALPKDVALNKNDERIESNVNEIPADLVIADIGAETIAEYSKVLKESKVAVLNGPMGVFENDEFKLGTTELFKAVAESSYSIAGGGHTVAAIEQIGLWSMFSHVSMGGGASVDYLSGSPLPGIEALKKAAKKYGKVVLRSH